MNKKNKKTKGRLKVNLAFKIEMLTNNKIEMLTDNNKYNKQNNYFDWTIKTLGLELFFCDKESCQIYFLCLLDYRVVECIGIGIFFYLVDLVCYCNTIADWLEPIENPSANKEKLIHTH